MAALAIEARAFAPSIGGHQRRRQETKGPPMWDNTQPNDSFSMQAHLLDWIRLLDFQR